MTRGQCEFLTRARVNPLCGLRKFVRARSFCACFFRRGGVARTCALVVFLAGVPSMPRSEPLAGPQSVETGALRRQLWRFPSGQPGVLMRGTLFRPPGAGPFPLLVMNHGTTQNAERRRMLPLPAFDSLARWFVRHGFAVAVPQRPGHGATGGAYREDQGGCDDADFARAGRGAADSIMAATAYLTAQPFIRRGRTIVAGQSAGGWAALAVASRAPPGLQAVINFAGGLGGRSYDRPDNNCAADRLIATAAEFGRTAHVPSLWLYTANDSYFPPRLAGAMADAYRAAGGKAEFALLPDFGADGHFMAETDSSESAWGPAVERFLAKFR